MTSAAILLLGTLKLPQLKSHLCIVLLSLHFDIIKVVSLLLPDPLNASDKDDLYKGNKLSEDEPDFDPLDVGGHGQLLDDTDQQGGDGQHHRHVHCNGSVEEIWELEERSGVADRDE